MAVERMQALATSGGPDMHRMIEPARRQELAILTEDNGIGTSARATKEIVQVPLGSAPEAQLVADQARHQELPGGGETQRVHVKHGCKGGVRQIGVAEVNCSVGHPAQI